MFGKQKLQFNIAYQHTARTTLATLGLVVLVCAYVISFGLFAGPVQPVEAAIPKYINFQGKLTAVSNGNNVANGSYSFEFKLYDAPSGGSLLWTETWDGSPVQCPQLAVAQGVFNAKLGACEPLTSVDFTGGALYLTVNFNPGAGFDGEMTPRKQLVSSAYAFVANSVSGDGVVNNAIQSTTALSTGRTGANPALQVDTNTASSVTGLKVTSAAAAGGLALTTISSGTNENLTIDAKGSGSVSINGSATGDVLLGGGSASTGCTLTNSTGAFACTSYGYFGSGSAQEIRLGEIFGNAGLHAGGDSMQFNIASSSDDFLFTSAAGQLVTIKGTGNVGIGTTAPTNLSGSYFGATQINPLWVSANDAAKVTALVVQGNLGEAIQFVNESGVAEADFGVYTTDIYFVNRQASGNIRFDTNGSTSMFVGSNNNVGIGTGISTPAAKLEIKGATGQLSTLIGDAGFGTSYAGLSMHGALTTGNYSLLGDATNLYINRPSSGDIFFRENNITQMTIKTSTGNVGIGDTSPASLFTVGSGDLFQVNSSGAIAASVGITTAGGAVSLNNNSNFATSISTGTNNTLTTIGGGSGTFSLQTTNIDISSAGAITDATGFNGLVVTANTGVITTGTWNGTAVGSQYGGTGQNFSASSGVPSINSGTWQANAITQNGVMYGGASNALSFTAVGTTGQCLVGNTAAAPSWSSCAGLVTLQAAYGAGNTIETASNNPVIITETTTGAVTGDLLQLTVNQATGGTFAGDAIQITMDGVDANAYTGNGLNIIVDQSQNTGSPILVQDDAATTLFQLSENGAITLGAATAETTAITITDTDFTNALSIADNNIVGTTSAIDFTNFDVSSAGAVVAVGVNSGSGLLQGTGGLTLTGTTNINTSGSSAVNIGTGGATSLVTIGGGSGTFSLQTTNIDISSAGAISGVTGYIQGSGTMRVTSANTNQSASSSALALVAGSVNSGTGFYVGTLGITTGNGMQIQGSGATMQTGGELIDLPLGANTVGAGITITSTGVYTGTGAADALGFNVVGNSLTTGHGSKMSFTGMTSGTGLLITGGGANLATNAELVDLQMGAATAGNGLAVTTSGVYTGTGLITLTANSATTGTIQGTSATGLTTGIAESITLGSALTTGGAYRVSSASYNHGSATETGSLVSLAFTDATNGTATSTTNGILISPTVNVTTGASGTKTINGVSVAPTFTACTGGSTCNPNGVNIGNVTDGTGITSAAIRLGTGWDTLISGTTAGGNLIDFTNFKITSAGVASALTGLSSSGTIQFSSLTTNGALYTSGGNGTLTTTAPTSGTIGYWSRTGTTLQPATANDVLSVANTTTTGADLALTNTGVYTGTGIFNLTANSATTGTLAAITGNGLTSGNLLSLSSNGTAALNNQTGLNISLQGAVTGAQATYGAQISNTHTGASAVNYALQLTASGATAANYALVTTAGDVQITTGRVTLSRTDAAQVLQMVGGNSGLSQNGDFTINVGGGSREFAIVNQNASKYILFVPGGSGTGNSNVGINTTTPGNYNQLRVLQNDATASQTRTAISAEATGAGATSVNVGLYATATGATNNYAAIFDAGNVGIGTTAPATTLQINSTYTSALNPGVRIRSNNPGISFDGTASGSARNFTIMSGYSTDTKFELLRSSVAQGTPDTVVFNVDGTTGFIGMGSSSTAANRIDVNGSLSVGGSYYGTAAPSNGLIVQGNVGIGITAPTAKLDVNGGSIQVRNGNTGGGFSNSQVLLAYSGTDSYRHTINSRHDSGSQTGNAIDFLLWDFGTDAAGTVGTKRVMTLQGNGNVGIGTTAPNSMLHVVKSDNGTDEIAKFFANNLTQGIGINYNSILAVGSNTNQNISIVPKGTGDLIINSGRTGIAYTPTTGTASLMVNGSAAIGSGTYLNATAPTNGFLVEGSVGIANTSPSALLTLGTAGTTAGTLSMAGSTSGTITIQPQAAAGTYNFNLPTTAGTSGYVLTSAGGGASPMTWTDPSGLGVRWNALVAPTGNLSLAHGANTTAFTFNSVTTSTAMDFSSTSLTTGKLLQLTPGTSLTTGSALSVTGATYNPGAGNSGNLLSLAFTNASSNTTGVSNVAGISIAPTISAAGSGGSQHSYGIRIQDAAGTVGAGTQNIYGVYIGNQGRTNADFSYGLYVGAQSGSNVNYAAGFGGDVDVSGVFTAASGGGQVLSVNSNDFQATGSSTTKLFLNVNAGKSQLGDVENNGNAVKMSIDDLNSVIEFNDYYSGSGFGGYIDKANGFLAWGDNNSNNTRITIDDGTQYIALGPAGSPNIGLRTTDTSFPITFGEAFGPSTDSTYSIGSSAKKFHIIYGNGLSLGTAATATGNIELYGSTSGTVTIRPQDSAGSYNFLLPTTAGTSGHLLTSGGGATAMTWTDPAALGVRWNALTAPSGNLSLAHGANTTAFTFNSVTTGTAFGLSSSSLSSGTLFNLAVTGTAAASNTQKALNISTSGANATSTQITYGGYFSNSHTGTSSTNVSLYSAASGGTTNKALQLDVVGGTDTVGIEIDSANSAPGTSNHTGIDIDARNFYGTTTTIRGINISAGPQSAGVGSTTVTGLQLQAGSLNAGGTVATAYGIDASLTSNNSAAITTGSIIRAYAADLGTGTYGTLYGLNLSNWSGLSATTTYGIYMDTSIDQGSTRYALYSSATSNSYMAGNLGLGDTSPAALLTVGSGDLFQVASNGNLTSSNAGTWTFSNDTNIALSGGVNGLSFDTDVLSIDATNNRVGIGTTSPSEQLQITGNFRLPTTTSTTGIIYQDSSLLMHTYGDNFFSGPGAGNLTLTNVYNTGVGKNSLDSLTTGYYNTALGHQSLTANTDGAINTAVGYNALGSNTSGGYNVAIGGNALQTSYGNNNVAVGFSAGIAVTNGYYNTLIGDYAGDNITSGYHNIVIGAGIDAQSATGANQLTIGNIIFGTGIDGTGTSLSSGNIGIGIVTPSEKLEIGSGGNISLVSGYLLQKANGRTRYYNSANSNYSDIYNPSTGGGAELAIVDGSGNGIRLNGSGNVGIGDTSPTSLFTVGSGDVFQVNTTGDIFGNMTTLNGSTTAVGSGSNSTSLTVSSDNDFDIGNYVKVDPVSGNCSGSTAVCYAKIVDNPSANVLTISPALTWDNGASVVEMHVPEVGGINTSEPLVNRYGRGYFIDGIVAGNGSTYFSDGGISQSLVSSTFNFLNNGNTTTLNLGTSATNVNVAGRLTVASGDLNIGAQTNANTGSTFTITNSAAGTFGSETARDGVSSFAIYNGKLYAATAETNDSSVYRFDGGTTWTKVTDSTSGKVVSADGDYADSMVLTVFNGKLYAGVNTGVGRNEGALYSYNGSSWMLENYNVGEFGSETGIDGISDMVVYGGVLIVATQEADAAQVYSYRGEGAFINISQGAGGSANCATQSNQDSGQLAVHNGRLFWGIATGSGGDGARLCVYTGEDSNGSLFVRLNTTDGTFVNGGLSAIDDISSLAVHNGRLYFGTAEPDSGEVYSLAFSNASDLEGRFGEPDLSFNPTGITAGVLDQTQADFTDSVPVLREYNGRLYAGTYTDVNDGNFYEYDDTTRKWDIINSAEGTFGSQTDVDSLSAMIAFNGTLYLGTSESGIGSVYTWSKTFTNSYALKFDSGSGNYGSISFVGNQTGDSNADNMGSFLFSHSLVSTTGAYDIAEDYPTREQGLVAGDVLSLNPNETGLVVRSSVGYDRTVVGIYSTKPGLRLSQQEAAINGLPTVPVALAGRVPVNIAPDSAPIAAGDAIVSSGTYPGKAMKALVNGPTIGKALESWTPGTGQTQVLVLVNLSWNGSSTGASSDIVLQAASDTAVNISDNTGSTLFNVNTNTRKLTIGTAADSAELELFGNIIVRGDAQITGSIMVESVVAESVVAEEVTAETITSETVTAENVVADSVKVSGNNISENYESADDSIEAGEVVAIDNSEDALIARADVSSSSSILGVVVEESGLELGSELEEGSGNTKYSVALIGRAQVKVSNENGEIMPGDFLANSDTIPGAAMKATKTGSVIGQALETFTGGVGKIDAFIKPSNYNGLAIENQLAGLTFDYTGTEQGLLNSAQNSTQILEYLISQLPSLDSENLSEVVTDVVVANGEIITPTVTTQTLRADFLSAATSDGGLSVASTTMFNGGLTVDTISAIGDLLSFSSDVEFFGTPYFTSDTAGFAVVKAGVQSVDVVFTREYLAQPIVNASISFEQDVDQELLDEEAREVLKNDSIAAAQTFLAEGITYVVTNKSKFGFTIVLSKPAPSDVKMSWTALAVRNATTFMSIDTPSGFVAGADDGDSGSENTLEIGPGGNSDSDTPPPGNEEQPPSDSPSDSPLSDQQSAGDDGI